MTVYTVYWKDNDGKQCATVYSLSAAKKLMKEHPGSVGDKVKIYSSGEWVPCGPITLKGSNKTFIANSKMTKPNY